MAVVIGLFVICWTPFFAFNFTFYVCRAMMWVTPGCQGSIHLPRVVYSVAKWLQYGNSVCNPIIYGLRNEEFRRTFRNILLRLCCKKVRLKEYDKNAHVGIRDVRKARSAPLQNEPGCESAITPSPQPMLNGYCQAIQSDNPIQLEILALSDNLRCS